MYTKNQFQTGSDMSVQLVSWYQPFVSSCLSIRGCFLLSINQNYFCCLSIKQCLPNLKKNKKKYLFFWVTWLCSTAQWRWTIHFTCTSIVTRQNTCWERDQLCHCKSWY